MIISGRQRVAAVIIRDGRILMVRERGLDERGRHRGQEYWTLPGGGINDGEEPEDAVRREVLEEVGLDCVSITYLFDFPYPSGLTACYAVEATNDTPRLGVDELSCECPRMVGLDWVPLPDVTSQQPGLPIPIMILTAEGGFGPDP